ncbi:hypothetical protein TL16_g06596 [Triparma laevis f. inornata]|nr:hypothetical protein TL16_g06596 [Triparma laevis f. inornata]
MWLTAYKTALGVLQVLENDNTIGNSLKSKVKDIIEKGEGLPLVFPEVELGFSYEEEGGVNEVRVGGRFPMICLEFEGEVREVRDFNRFFELRMEEIWPVSVVIGWGLDELEKEHTIEYEGTHIVYVEVIETESDGVSNPNILFDPGYKFRRLCESSELKECRAVLVRPDGHVGRIYNK